MKVSISRWTLALLAAGIAAGTTLLFERLALAPFLWVLAMMGASAWCGRLVPSTPGRALGQEPREQALFHSVLGQLGQQMFGDTELPALLDQAVFLLAGALSVELLELLVLNEDRQSLQLRAGLGWREDLVGQSFQETGRDSPAGYALLTRAPVLLEQLSAEERFQAPPRLHDLGVTSGLCVLIEGVDTPFGVLGAYTRKQRRFTREEVQFVQSLAGLLTLAVRHQHLLDSKRELAERLHLLSEELGDSMNCLLEASGRVVDWSAGSERLTGWKAEEIIGQDLSRFYPAEVAARGKASRALQVAEAEGRFEDTGYRVRKDGSRFWANLVLTALRAPGGALRGFMLVVKDLTSIRRAEQERGHLVEQLKEESRLAAVLTQLPAGVLIAEVPSGRSVLWNRQTEEILRRPFQPLASLEDYKHRRSFRPDGQPCQGNELPLARAVLSGEVVKDEEFVIERGDGTRGTVLVSAAPVQDAEGRPSWAVLTFFDVTERKKAEEAQRFLAEAGRILGESLELEETLERLEGLSLFGSTGRCGFLLVGEDGSTERLSAADNPQAKLLLQVLRRTEGEVLQTQKPVLVTHVSESHLQALASDEEHPPPPGEAPLASYAVVPLVARSRIIGVIGAISTRREFPLGPQELATLEELARRAALAIDNARLYQQARDAIRARDELFSIAAHELRTPLNALHLKAQVLQRSLRSQPTHEQDATHQQNARLREGIQVIAQQADRLSRMIGTLLDISRIRVGQLQLDPEELELSRVVGEVVERMREALAAAGCEPRLELTEGATGHWDRMRLEQVVTNLLSNALKYGVGKPVEVRVWKDERLARVSVRDHGIGIPPDKLERIFGRFERAVSGREFAGLGLGLYVTRQIIEEHGGGIRVESSPGEGSTFTVELPREPSAAPRGAQRPSEGPPPPEGRVLHA